MEDNLSLLVFGAIAVLVILLIVFEILEGRFGKSRAPKSNGYEYYTETGDVLRIRHFFGSLFKVYTYGPCPAATKKDRFGTYFPVRARSSAEAESVIDGIYRRGG